MTPDSIIPASAASRGIRPVRAVAAGLIALFVGCLGDERVTGVVNPPPPLPAGLVVSDPAPSPALAAPRAGTLGHSAAASETPVYVSLVPGTAPQGVTGTIRNTTSGVEITTAVRDGGFDPVAIGASVGAILEIVVRAASGTPVLQARTAVAGRRRPSVVRTDPPPQKRDVPLNAVIVIVFSEPIDASTLTGAAVRLATGSVPVVGRLEFRDPANLTAAFVPATPLAANTTYDLVITQGIRDLDGDSLETPVSVEFTTVTVEPQLAFNVQPTNMGAGLAITPHVQVAAQDAFGNTDLSFAGSISIAIGNGSSGGSLSGTTTVAAVAGVATFADLRIDAVGAGYTLLAAASGYRSDASTPFDITTVGPPTGRIAFESSRAGSQQVGRLDIYVMNADGSGVTRLTTDSGYHWAPAWSRDGSRIVFSLDPLDDRDRGLYVMSADGSGMTYVPFSKCGWSWPGGGSSGPSSHAAWSPDGSKIAFDCYYVFNAQDEETSDIRVVNADGSGVTILTDHAAYRFDRGPTWRPDGVRIAFSRNEPNEAYEWGTGTTYAINPDGAAITEVVKDADIAAWSPDGTKIAFVSRRDGNNEIYVVSADGSGRTRLTSDPAEDIDPAWSPDGTRIAFARLVDGSGYQIYVMNADGSGVTRLTDSPGRDVQPAWSPR